MSGINKIDLIPFFPEVDASALRELKILDLIFNAPAYADQDRPNKIKGVFVEASFYSLPSVRRPNPKFELPDPFLSQPENPEPAPNPLWMPNHSLVVRYGRTALQPMLFKPQAHFVDRFALREQEAGAWTVGNVAAPIPLTPEMSTEVSVLVQQSIEEARATNSEFITNLGLEGVTQTPPA